MLSVARAQGATQGVCHSADTALHTGEWTPPLPPEYANLVRLMRVEWVGISTTCFADARSSFDATSAPSRHLLFSNWPAALL